MEERVSDVRSGIDRCCSSDRDAERVVRVAWVEGGRVLGFGRTADGGIAIVRIEAAVVEMRRKAERKRVDNMGRYMVNLGKTEPGLYDLGFHKMFFSQTRFLDINSVVTSIVIISFGCEPLEISRAVKIDRMCNQYLARDY